MSSFNNFIASLDLIPFALLYIAWIVFVLGLVWFIQHLNQLSQAQEESDFPTPLDPYQIAYMRSEEDPIYLAIYSLLYQRLLQKSKTNRALKRTARKLPSDLHPLELAVYHSIKRHPNAHKITIEKSLLSKVNQIFKHTRKSMAGEKLTADRSLLFLILRGAAMVLIAGLGIVKVSAIMDIGEGNILLPLFIGFTGCFLVYEFIRQRRLTLKGRKTLEKFKNLLGPASIDEEDLNSVLLGLSIADTHVLPPSLQQTLYVDFRNPYWDNFIFKMKK